MRDMLFHKTGFRKVIISLIMILFPIILTAQQQIGFGVHFDPVISWLGSDVKETKSNGARAGFNFGLTYNKYFTKNYSFSTGISLINAGGKLTYSDTTVLQFSNFKSTVLPGKPVIYTIKYLSVPIGLKLQTNQIGYLTFFTDLGLDPKVVIGGKADIPSLSITGENAIKELRTFNLSYHISGGIEYSLGGTTAIVLGLNFEDNFLDVTRDTGKISDVVTHKLLSFRLGINF
jgi:hypothetical protein